MTTSKVAIITRTKDRPLLLERCINKTLEQTYKNWTHVIVNDDGDKEIINSLVKNYQDKYQGRVKLIHREVSKGMEVASNDGIKNSESDYIVILDDDDTWEEDFLKKTVTYLDENPSIGGVMTHSNYVIEKIKNETIEILDKYPFNTDISNLNLFDMILKKVYPPTMSFVFKRSCYEELEGFNEEFLKAGDIEFTIRFLAKFDIDVIPEALSNIHARPYAANIYSNSSLGNKNYKDHSYWENKLKNHLLRLDLNENKLGIGFLYNSLCQLSPFLQSKSFQSVFKRCKGKKVLLYGAGLQAKETLQNYKTEFNMLNVLGILDQNALKQGTNINGYKVFPPESIKDLKPDKILLTVANKTMVKPFIEKLISKYGLDCEIIST